MQWNVCRNIALGPGIAETRAETQEKEREEIGKELHDNIKQMLAGAKMYLGYALQYPVKEQDMIQKSLDIINSSIQELRNLSSTLVSSSSGDKSLTEKVIELIGIFNSSGESSYFIISASLMKDL